MLSAVMLTASAQTTSENNLSYSGTNSPYSQFGFGELAEQGSGFNRGMNGLGLGFREHNQVNHLNPASYSAIDSLSFIFDAGVYGQLSNFKEDGLKVNAKNAGFDYVVAGFRVFKHVGVSAGLIPFANMSYKYTASGNLNTDKSVTYTNTYRGSGGLHQVYLGVGWEIFRNFSLGVNGSYMWGDYDRNVTNGYSDSWVNTIQKSYRFSVSNYKLDFGVQYTLPLNANNHVTLGATFSPGHNLHADPECEVISTNSSTGVSDTTSYSLNNALKLPTMIGVGFAYNYGNRLKLGLDYQLQQWSKTSFPVHTVSNDVASYKLSDNYFRDRHKITLGGTYCRDEYGRRFFSRLRYRFGASYATSYLKINGQDGPKEMSLSAGVGIPIVNAINNRSILNISVQWVNQKASSMIDVNTFRINLGFTFNERWFQKWKVE